MKPHRLMVAAACAACLAGCATTGDQRMAAQPGVYADGYYVPADQGSGDYYYDDPQTVTVHGSWSVGLGFGNGWYGPGFGPAFGPWGWGGWGWGGWGWRPWGYAGWSPWYGGWPGYWHHPGYAGHGVPATIGATAINRYPRQGMQLQSRSVGHPPRMERPPPRGREFRENGHGPHRPRP